MRVHIRVTVDDGNSYEGEVELVPLSSAGTTAPGRKTKVNVAVTPPSAGRLDFDLPVRAFVNRYAKNLSGPRKYAVLVARLCGGTVGQTVSPREVERQWRSMTEPMGGDYNAAYASRAKNEGWVDAPDRNSIVLLKHWTNALNGD
jgi:hypothetical protein